MPPRGKRFGRACNGGKRDSRIGGGRRNLDGAEHLATNVAGDDAGDDGTDVDADCQIRLVVDLERNSRTPDCSGGRQVRAFAQDPEVQQARDLPVHGGNTQPGRFGRGIARERSAGSSNAQHRRGRTVGNAQLRCNYLGSGPGSRERGSRSDVRNGGDCGCRHGCPLQKEEKAHISVDREISVSTGHTKK